MNGPKTPAEARRWIREAVAARRYLTLPHFDERLRARHVTLDDVLRAIHLARAIEPHVDPPKFSGTCWRVYGPCTDGRRELGVGVEACFDDQGRLTVFVTVLPPRKKGNR